MRAAGVAWCPVRRWIVSVVCAAIATMAVAGVLCGCGAGAGVRSSHAVAGSRGLACRDAESEDQFVALGAAIVALQFPFDPRTDRQAAGCAVRLSVSRDDGRTYRPTESSPYPRGVAYGLYASGRQLWAFGGRGLYESADAGDRWHRVLPDTDRVVRLAVAGPFVVVLTRMCERLTSCPGAIVSSDDGGRDWWSLRLARTNGTEELWAALTRSRDAYALVDSRWLYRTDTGGARWARTTLGPDGVPLGGDPTNPPSIAISPDGTVFALVGDGSPSTGAGTERKDLYRSNDHGQLWRHVITSRRLPDQLDVGLPGALSATQPGTLLVSPFNATGAISRNNGRTWRAILPIPGDCEIPAPPSFDAIGMSTPLSGVQWTAENCVWVTTDDWRTWTRVQPPRTAP
jgi:hypothetical protein